MLEKLKSLGLEENTLVIITSDHGEEFGGHGHIGHSQTPFESVMHVPLLIRAPSQIQPGIEIHRAVSLVDILPTVLAVLDSASPSESPYSAALPPLHGISLLGLMQGESSPARQAVFAESRRAGHKSIVARTDTHRFITPQNKRDAQQIFDLRVDPTEQKNLQTPALQAKGRRLAKRYANLRDAAAGLEQGRQKTQSVDPETAAKLRALGYTED